MIAMMKYPDIKIGRHWLNKRDNSLCYISDLPNDLIVIKKKIFPIAGRHVVMKRYTLLKYYSLIEIPLQIY